MTLKFSLLCSHSSKSKTNHSLSKRLVRLICNTHITTTPTSPPNIRPLKKHIHPISFSSFPVLTYIEKEVPPQQHPLISSTMRLPEDSTTLVHCSRNETDRFAGSAGFFLSTTDYSALFCMAQSVRKAR